MKITKLVFIGGGNMAHAIFAGLIDNPQFIIEVIQRNPEKAAKLKASYPNLTVTPTLNYQLPTEDIVILAVKPQQAKEACLAIKDLLNNCLIVSVMAGVTVNAITNWLNISRVIRIMPNTPLAIKQGVSAIYATVTVNKIEQQLIEQVFSNLGLVYIAQTEAEVDKMVALSGSGVAFVYYFMEGMINSAVKRFGFSEDDATAIIKQVVSGGCALLAQNPNIKISEQRQLVTSKKGTTERGILALHENQLHQIIDKAMEDSYERALQLGQEFQ